ncbi:MAG: hypothetical protein ACP5HX_11340, partial [Thermoproteota archaeon]
MTFFLRFFYVIVITSYVAGYFLIRAQSSLTISSFSYPSTVSPSSEVGVQVTVKYSFPNTSYIFIGIIMVGGSEWLAYNP